MLKGPADQAADDDRTCGACVLSQESQDLLLLGIVLARDQHRGRRNARLEGTGHNASGEEPCVGLCCCFADCGDGTASEARAKTLAGWEALE